MSARNQIAMFASCSAVALATLAGGAASAQTTPAPDSASAASTVEELVVTATRREQRLQDVPLAVSAITGDKLVDVGLQNITDIQYVFTGVQFGTTPNDAGFRLRGVGSSGGFTSASEQPVGLVVDSVVVPFGNPVAGLGDLERVEVLKGPQGTQFGKNASSGVVNIVTKKPVLGAFGGSAYASYAELNERDLHAAVNLPLGETAALNLFVFDRAHDGFLENVTQNRDWGADHTYGGRAKLLWQPTDALSVQLIGDYSDTQNTGPGQLWSLNTVPPGYLLLNPPFYDLNAAGVVPGFENDKTIEEYSTDIGQQNYGVSLELNYELGDYTLTSVSAFRGQDEDPVDFAIDGTAFPVFTAQSTGPERRFYSQEFRLTSPAAGRLKYVGGAYFSRLTSNNGDGESAQLRPALPFVPIIISITNGFNQTETISQSVAAFVDGSYDITDQLKLLAGGRVTYDHVEASNFSRVDPSLPPFNPPPPFGTGPSGTVPYTPRPLQTAENSGTGFSGRIGLEYNPTEDVMFYGTYAHGYLGPTVTFSGLTGTKSAVDPQKVDDITIGAKTQFFDRRLTLNANVFWDWYKDLQIGVFDGVEFLTENAGGFEAKGFEIEATVRASDQFTFNGGVTYSDAEFTDYVTSCPSYITGQGPAAVAAQCNAPGSTTATPLYQAAGQPLPGAPKWTVNLGVSFKQPIGSSLMLDAGANYYYRSEVQNSVGDPNTIHPGYSLVNLTLGIGDADGRWRLGGFARNVFDQTFHNGIIGLPFAPPGGYVNWMTREGRRTIGVSIEGRF